MKKIIETFQVDIQFPCVSSVVFEAITIWISRDLPARRAEHFDTTHDFLGRKLTILENCIFQLGQTLFQEETFFFKNRYNKSNFLSDF